MATKRQRLAPPRQPTTAASIVEASLGSAAASLRPRSAAQGGRGGRPADRILQWLGQPNRPQSRRTVLTTAISKPSLSRGLTADAKCTTGGGRSPKRLLKAQTASSVGTDSSALTTTLLESAHAQSVAGFVCNKTRGGPQRNSAGGSPETRGAAAATARTVANATARTALRGQKRPLRGSAINALKLGSEAPQCTRTLSNKAADRAALMSRREEDEEDEEDDDVDDDVASDDSSDDAASGDMSKCSRRSSMSSSPVQVKLPGDVGVKRALSSIAPLAAHMPADVGTLPKDQGGEEDGVQRLKTTMSADDEGTLQAAVLNKLRDLCGEHEDAKVLAEYIVVMVAGNKGKDEMALELMPFFPDQAQADAFVDWVVDCKGKSAAGDVASTPPAGGEAHASSFTISADALSAEAAAKSALISASSSSEAFAAAADLRTAPGSASVAVRPGPHVAVTSRVVLQPNPSFAGSTAAPAASTSTSSIAVATAASRSDSNPVKANKLLENMTKQLQTILTKLSDKSLNDTKREKYQALAQNIQMLLSRHRAPPRRM